MYDPDIDRWSMIEPTSTARWDGGIAVESDKSTLLGDVTGMHFALWK